MTATSGIASRVLVDRKAAFFGYNDEIIGSAMQTIEGVETHLRSLFPQRFGEVQFESIEFVTADPRLEDAIAGTDGGTNFIIDCAKLPPHVLLRRLVVDSAHEYAHALTLKRPILLASVPEQQKFFLGLKCSMEPTLESLYRLNNRALSELFVCSLEEGIDNPFISGLRYAQFDFEGIYSWYDARCSDYHELEFFVGRVIFGALELITERIAELIMPASQDTRRAVREIIDVRVSSTQGREISVGDAFYLRVYAEKTGNADLVRGLTVAAEEVDLYERLCAGFSILWDQIDLKTS